MLSFEMLCYSSIEQVFKYSGKEATKAMMRSLDKTVDPNVIDIWSFLVNKKEIAKSGQKPARVCMTVYRYVSIQNFIKCYNSV